MRLYADRTLLMGTENAFKIGPHIEKVMASGQSVIKLNLGEPDFTPPQWVKDEIISQIRAGNMKYCDPQGILPLRQAIAKSVGEMRTLEISPEQVCVFPGGKPSIAFTQQIYCNPGDEIIYPSPGFPIYESMVRYLGAVPVPLHLKEEENFTFGPDQLKELITDKTKLIILNFPSNPTGGVADMAQLKAIADVILSLGREDIRVYSDEIYENIIFGDAPHASIASVPGMETLTLISSGFSKSYAWTGGRIGYVVCPSVEEAQLFKNMNINYFSCVPPDHQQGAITALEHPESGPWMKKMTAEFEGRALTIVPALNAIDGVTCQMPRGTFYAFPNISGLCERLGVMTAHENLPEEIKTQTTVTGLFQMFALYCHGVAVMDRSSFGAIGAENQHFIRLSIASSLEELQEGVKRIAAAGDDVQGFADFIKNEGHLA